MQNFSISLGYSANFQVFFKLILKAPHSSCLESIFTRKFHYFPPMKLWEGNVFSHVCLIRRLPLPHTGQLSPSPHREPPGSSPGLPLPFIIQRPSPGMFKLVQLGPHCKGSQLPSPMYMSKLIHYVVYKRVVGIKLKCLLV